MAKIMLVELCASQPWIRAHNMVALGQALRNHWASLRAPLHGIAQQAGACAGREVVI